MTSSVVDRRGLLHFLLASGAYLALPRTTLASPPYTWAKREIERQHDETIQRILSWIDAPAIASLDTGYEASCNLTMQLLRDAGFQRVNKIETSGKPGIFAILDAGAPRTVGLYFMYDVMPADPKEWSSPPFAAALVDKPGMGKSIVGRGAANQKGPEGTFLAALHAFRSAGRRPPVNLVLIAEGEEEIGSPHIAQLVHEPAVLAALKKCSCIFMPDAGQNLAGTVQLTLGAKGIVEVELVCSAQRWGRGAEHDLHSGYKAIVDSPTWHLVEALDTLVSPDGSRPAIDGFFDHVRPLSERDAAIIARAASAPDAEEVLKKALAVNRWTDDANFSAALKMLANDPTINIEALIAGYTGTGSKTILPSRAIARLDLRLVPDMSAKEILSKLRDHLDKRGFGDIEIRDLGSYDPTETSEDSVLIRGTKAIYALDRVPFTVSPRLPSSWPGYIFTGEPLHLPAGFIGIGHGSGAHAPDEYLLVESVLSGVAGIDEATLFYVKLLYELATIR
jgi:acetylornithine deacetylase/succinyl-diaminopimelate desuccinylase-like protein